jgi:hypothetical protein
VPRILDEIAGKKKEDKLMKRIGCLLLILCSLTTACAGRQYYKEMMSSFWKDTNSVSVILMSGEGVNALNTPGRVDGSKTTKKLVDKPMNEMMQPSALLAGPGVFLGGVFENLVVDVIEGPEREGTDPEFHTKINDILRNCILTKEDYFGDTFLQKLSYPPHITSYSQISSKSDIKKQLSELNPGGAARYLLISLYLTMWGKSHGWSPKASLFATASVLLIRDEKSLQSFFIGKFKPVIKGRLVSFEVVSDVPGEEPKVINLLNFSAYTKEFEKSKWLADNGQLFDQQLRLVLQQLASRINQGIFNIN